MSCLLENRHEGTRIHTKPNRNEPKQTKPHQCPLIISSRFSRFLIFKVDKCTICAGCCHLCAENIANRHINNIKTCDNYAAFFPSKLPLWCKCAVALLYSVWKLHEIELENWQFIAESRSKVSYLMMNGRLFSWRIQKTEKNIKQIPYW